MPGSIAVINQIMNKLKRFITDGLSGNLDTEVADESIMGHLLASSDVTDFDRTKHSLEAIGEDTDDILEAVGSFGANPRVIGEYTADGNIAKGDFVGITPAGKATTVTVVSPPLPIWNQGGAYEAHDAISTDGLKPVIWFTATKCVIVYDDGSNNIYVCVGNVGSNGEIDLETPEDTTLNGYVDANRTLWACKVKGFTNKIAIAFNNADDGADLYLAIITFSGNAIDTVGTADEFSSESNYHLTCCSPDTDVVVVGYSKSTVTPKARACSISGTTVSSWGTEKELDTNAADERPIDCDVLDTTHVAFCWQYSGAQTVIGSLSGLTITTGIIVEAWTSSEADPKTCIRKIREGILLVAQSGLVVKVAPYDGTTIHPYSAQVTSDDGIYADTCYVAVGIQGTALAVSGDFGSPSSNRLHTIQVSPIGEVTLSDAITIDNDLGDPCIGSFEYNFVIAGHDTGGDLFAWGGAFFGGVLLGCLDDTPGEEIDGLLGVAQEAINDGVSGDICTFGVPLSNTNAGMSEEYGWYSTGSKFLPLVLRKRDGDVGLWAMPLAATEMIIRPQGLGDNSWM
ncbi:hypothetical protein ACFL5H_00360 [Candidatus Latescibacterota bacterium]